MKKIIIILAVILLIAFIGIQLFFMNAQRDIETYSYKVEKNYTNFEIRNYEATLFTSVDLSSKTFDETSSEGFSVLAEYIFGGNKKEEKIAMTSPVSMSLGDSSTMMFMVPKKFNKNTLPEPNKSKVKFVTEPAKKVAAISFGGWANKDKIEDYKQQLISALKSENIIFKNRFYFLGYNAPFEVFNRKNEIIVELEN